MKGTSSRHLSITRVRHTRPQVTVFKGPSTGVVSSPAPWWRLGIGWPTTAHSCIVRSILAFASVDSPFDVVRRPRGLQLRARRPQDPVRLVPIPSVHAYVRLAIRAGISNSARLTASSAAQACPRTQQLVLRVAGTGASEGGGMSEAGERAARLDHRLRDRRLP